MSRVHHTGHQGPGNPSGPMSQVHHTGHQGPNHPPGYGPGPPPPPGYYPSAVPPFGGLPPPPPRPQSYQGYFDDYSRPTQQPYYHHQHYGPQDPLCFSFLRGCLATLCCCCLLERCCY